MERVLRTRLFAGVVLAVVFGAGVVLGLAIDQNPGPRDDRGRGEETHRTPTYMKVDPTEQQKTQIDSILRKDRAAMRELHEEFRAEYEPRYQALVKQTREAIKSVLTPEQAAKYDSIHAEYDRKRSERSQRPNRE